jgi:hypothetical protein
MQTHIHTYLQDCRVKLQVLLENVETGTAAYKAATPELVERLEADMLRAVKAQLYPAA